MGSEQDGGYAEWVVVSARDVLPMPNHLDFKEAACLPLTYLTAWHMLVRKARVRPGEDVLITAIGSGVGVATLQVAKAFGAHVLAAASTEGKLQKAREAGADECINYSCGTFAERVMQLTDARGVDVVIDSVGSQVFLEGIAALAVGGRIASCGATADARTEIDLHALQAKRATIYFTVMGSRADLADAIHLVCQQRLHPIIHQVLPLAKTQEAHRLLEGRAVFGKLVLVPMMEA
jgi:NADPH:quinone reductase-like Zn-dependent oxidoreductase